MLLSDLRDIGIIIHVIGVCETFLTDSSSVLIYIENYTGLHKIRSSRSGGGTSIYYHNSTRYLSSFDTPFNESFESIAVSLQYKGRIMFCSEYYCIPNSDDKLFMISLKCVLQIGCRFKINFLCSDQNYDLKKMDSHHATQEFCAILNEHKLIPTIMKLTRVTHSTASVINNICLKYPTIVNHESFVLIDGMSDHYPCLLSCELMGVCKDRLMILVEKRKVTEAKLDKIQ